MLVKAGKIFPKAGKVGAISFLIPQQILNQGQLDDHLLPLFILLRHNAIRPTFLELLDALQHRTCEDIF